MIISRIAFAFLALSLSGCGNKSTAQTTPTRPSEMNPTLEIKLLVDPTKLAMADRDSFKIGFEAVNRGAAPIDPQLHDAFLTANGKRVYAWDLAIQNGIRDESWTKLPPGGTVDESWQLGKAIFEQPGTYELVLTLGAQKSTAQVEVTP